MNNFIQHLIGTTDAASFAASFVFAVVGIILSLKLHSKKRNKADASTPYRFSIKFLLLDNIDRISFSLLLIFVALRFCKELTGMQLNMFVAFGLGFGLDKIVQKLKALSFTARK